MNPQINVITKEIYLQYMQREDIYEDCTESIDLKALKNQLKSKKTIKKVVILTRRHPDFRNIANKDITYQSFRCALETDDGMYYGYYGGCRLPGIINPLGDAFVVI
jgi:hypothetical protein